MRGLLLAVALLAAPAAANEAESNVALRALFAAGATPIPARSTCAGNLPGVTRLTLGAIVASRLAVFDAGVNRVSGQCRRGACALTIEHANGEDVSSAEFRFLTSKGVLVPATLRCQFTP